MSREKAQQMLAEAGYARGGRAGKSKIPRAKAPPAPARAPMPPILAAPMSEPDGDEMPFKRGGRVGC